MKSTPDLEKVMRKLDMIFNEINTPNQYVLLKTIMWRNTYTKELFIMSDIKICYFSKNLESNFKAKFKLSDAEVYKYKVKISSEEIK